MIRQPLLCTVCGRPIVTKLMKDNKVADTLDDLDELSTYDDDLIETIGMCRTKVWNTRKLFPCLCEGCASAIDQALLLMKTEMMERERLLIRNKALNEKRKKELGTKG